MLDVTHLRQVPLLLFNKLEEVRGHPHMGPSMCNFASLEKGNLVVIHV
jgi:hypothetical protein